MKRSYLYLLLAVFMVLVLIIYNQLGGFKEVVFTRVEPFEYRITGKEFNGKITEKEWENLFYEMKDYLDNDMLHGDLVIVWYQQPDKETKTGKAFVGIDMKEDVEIPDSLVFRKISCKGILRAELIGNILVLPKPEKVIGDLQDFALKEGVISGELVIDRYTVNEDVYTEIPFL
jgi:hypothetical protein